MKAQTIDLSKDLEIRRMLGDKYHLSMNVSTGEWRLYRRYINPSIYYSNDNKPIMSCETHTFDELYKFAKEHREKGFSDVMQLCVYISVGLCILNILGLVFRWSNYIRGMIIGAILMLVLMDTIIYLMSDHNFRIRMRELKDGMRDLFERER